MQFTNTSGVTSQTDTNQHNAGGELHARLRNDEQHTSTPGPAGVEGAGGTGGPDRGAGGRRRSLSTHKRQARTIGGAAGPAGPGRTSHRHPDRLEAAARPAGPGRGAGGRRQGLAGLRDDAPSAARGADGERAGRCPPAHTAARPNKTGHAAAGPGRASRRHAEPIISTPGSTGVEDTGGNCRGAGGRWWRRTAGVEDTGGPGRGAGGRRQGLAGLREDTPSRSSAHPAPLVWRTPGARPRCRWAAAGPGRASRSTTPSEARVWRSRGRGAAHRHQHAGTNTQPQTHRHNEAARPHRGRAAHASGR